MGMETKTERLIKAAISRLSKAKKGAASAEFAQVFYGQSVPDELAEYSAPDLAAIAASAMRFAAKRSPGRHKIRVFNPEVKADGWSDGATVVQILNDDMPFLVDSVLSLLSDLNAGVRLVLHPIISLSRSNGGTMAGLAGDDQTHAANVGRESLIHVHIDPIFEKAERSALEEQISPVLDDVRTTVLDWQPMVGRVRNAVSSYQTNPPSVAVDELAESIQFLQWLLDNHFTFLGIREYAFEGRGAKGQLKAVPKSGLGILRDPSVQVLRRGRQMVSITPEVREFLMQPAPLIITKANVRATVHRRVYMDYVGVKQFDDKGQLSGELRLVGLFTSAAYTRSAQFIPLLRRKVGYVVEHSGYKPESHSGKALLNVIEQYPRDELFQSDAETLIATAKGILQLEERPRTRLFVRTDKFDRFASALVFIPRDRFNTRAREKVGELLCEAYDGRLSAFYPAFPEGSLVRVHYIIGRMEGETPKPDVDELERQVLEIVKTWDDRLVEAITAHYEADRVSALRNCYINAFSGAYQEAFEPAQALGDIDHIENLSEESDLGIDFYRGPNDADTRLRLKIYHMGEPIPLSDRLPILENMGLRAIDERSYKVSCAGDGDAAIVWIHEIALEASAGEKVDLDAVKPALEACFLAVWRGDAENDTYNNLVLKENLPWRDVSMLRACGKYLRQTGLAFSARYVEGTLISYSDIAALLVKLFYARFDLNGAAKGRDGAQKRILSKIEAKLQNVPSLDQDRILRRFANLITVTLRTNFFQTVEDGGHRPAIAMKIRSKEVDGLPEPRPYAEIFVYSPDVEGVHLRFGMIARGGLRWSDRPEDFRTEVLGLVKAQQVKNAVIVPVGSKGGFVPKHLGQATSRQEFLDEGIRCYKIFISSLLDVTDNLHGTKLVPPKDVTRHDGDDPYLVVAADKGTATFSDIANGISDDRGHWLSDAFASGGSAGYDHKKMGITARGAWEAVKRHFREMDRDIQTTPFTVIGVGDMSGDVFGNGMLLSKQTKLVAAFDHRDIIIDPDPDTAASYKERKRLFNSPGTTWADYDAKLISKGGGVFSRSLKAIDLSDEIRALTGLTGKQAAPLDLIQALLKAEADLLWFGGIGTYIRATTETDDDAGDRANDAVRITAKELRVKVIGEGANLGLTQRARVEFALNGGRANTDAVDNSAGVNSSDVEVNIKITLGAAEVAGKLTRPARNKLLAEMTDEVAGLCLRNNYVQTLALSLIETRGLSEMGFQARLMRKLEHEGELDREIEFLPDEADMAEREAQSSPLSRPELSVLLAYAKITLFDRLLGSKVPDDPYLERDLMRYFPTRLQGKYPDEIRGHRLRREIIATMLANSMINRGGASFINRIIDETGADEAAIATAYILARESFGFIDLNGEIDALDNKIPSEVQMELYLAVQDLVRQQTVWFLRNVTASGDLAQYVAHYSAGLTAIEKAFDKVLPEAALKGLEADQKELVARKVPKEVAQKITYLQHLSRAPDVILVAAQSKKPVEDVARVFYGLGASLNLDRIAAGAGAIPVVDYFERLAVNRTLESIFASQRGLSAQILAKSGAKKNAWEAWSSKNSHSVGRAQTAIEELVSGHLTLAKLAVASSHLRDLLQG